MQSAVQIPGKKRDPSPAELRSKEAWRRAKDYLSGDGLIGQYLLSHIFYNALLRGWAIPGGHDLSGGRIGWMGQHAMGRRQRRMVTAAYAALVVSSLAWAVVFWHVGYARLSLVPGFGIAGGYLGLRRRWRRLDAELVREVMET